MVTWVVFGLMAGAVLAAFRAVVIVLRSRQAVREGMRPSTRHLSAMGEALEWALWSATCVLLLSLGGLWRVAHMVTR